MVNLWPEHPDVLFQSVMLFSYGIFLKTACEESFVVGEEYLRSFSLKIDDALKTKCKIANSHNGRNAFGIAHALIKLYNALVQGNLFTIPGRK